MGLYVALKHKQELVYITRPPHSKPRSDSLYIRTDAYDPQQE